MSNEWRGQEHIDRLNRALKMGVDKTTSDATLVAKSLVHVEFAVLQGSIRSEPARLTATGVVGAFGPHDVEYAVAQEFLLGEKMPDGSIRSRRGGKPYMRPAHKSALKALRPNIIAAEKASR